ncbi:hypothetical protein KJ903_03275 [Patescibacteria group bacterium]|nr:hypothetical protein [Patescibacteria group bacterium]
MKTVMDVIGANQNVIMVERHGDYFMGPLIARLLAEGVPAKQVQMIAYARNYSRLEPDCMFALNSTGVRISREQGAALAKAGVEIAEIIGSHQARGPDTGLFICEGYHEESGKWPPFRCHAAIDYPQYEYEVIHRALCEVGDPFLAQWLNGDPRWQRVVISDTPQSFKGRVLGFIEDLFRLGGGTRILTSHFEIVTLVHGLLVEGKQLGEFDESWAPTKNGGVILWYEWATGMKIHARDYRPDLTLV